MADVPKLIKKDFGHVILNAVLWMASRGWTNEKMAETLGVDPQNLTAWIQNSDSIRARVTDSRREVVSAIEHSLIRLALGYRTQETKVFYNAVSGEIVEHAITKQHLPDSKAAIFLLKNLDPENWKERHEVDVKDTRKPTVSSVAEAMALIQADPARMKLPPPEIAGG